MRIRKTKQIIPNMSKVIRANDTPNDKDVYSSLDVKNMISGKILWTNPNPSNDFEAQTIELSSSDWDIYEVFYSSSKGTTELKIMYERSYKGQGMKLNSKVNANDLCDREIYYESQTSLYIYGAYINNNLNNQFLIPQYIIGYKTGLFS